MLHALLSAIFINPNDVGLPTSTSNLGEALSNTVKLLMTLIGGLSIIFIVVGGIQIATAAGNPARYKQGREAVIYSIVGLVVAMAAYAIVTFITTRV